MVTGLPGAPAAITVTGPSGFTRPVTATTTLSTLTPGSYTITASNVVAVNVTYAAAPAAQTVVVVPSLMPAKASVAYLACPTPNNKILVDSSHDGGVWWFPQAGPFVSASFHQGQALADYLRGKGYVVDELARGVAINATLLAGYTRVIRTAGFEAYGTEELEAYTYLASCPVTILLLGEYLRAGQQDPLAAELGVTLTGSFTGSVTTFASHPITAGVDSVEYIAGSEVNVSLSKSVVVLGWLQTGEPVMGIETDHPAKIFFLGDVNGIEGVPQPLVDNLIAWGF